MKNWIKNTSWTEAYDDYFELVIGLAAGLSEDEGLTEIAAKLSKIEVQPASNAGIIARIVRTLIYLRFPTSSEDFKQLVLKDASKILIDLSRSKFSEYDANLLAAIAIRAYVRDAEFANRTKRARAKFEGAKFQTRLVHPKIRDFAIAVDPELAYALKQF